MAEIKSKEQNMKNILVVDDVIDNIQVINGILKNDYVVQAALDGVEALELVKKSKPDLILLDVMMPGMDGFEVCQSLKKDPEFQDIPVIFITALADIFNEEQGFKAGAVDYITKPAKPAIVKARIATHLKILEQKRELEEKNNKLEKIQRVLVSKLARACVPENLQQIPMPIHHAVTDKAETEEKSDYFLDDHKNDLLEVLESLDSIVNLMILKKRFDIQSCQEMRRWLYRFGTILSTYPSFSVLGDAILNFSDVFGRIDEEINNEDKIVYIFEILESFSFTLGRWAIQIFEMQHENPNVFDNSIISDVKTIQMMLENKDEEIETEIDFF